MATHGRFSWKAFITFYITLSFLVLGLSGLILYVAPPGRVANWSIWRFGALTKAQWQAVHTVMSFVFLAAAGLHLSFNWKVLTAYLRSRLHDGMRMKRELAAAVSAGALLLALTVAGVPPFSTLMEVGDDIKNAWATPADEPPVAHAEVLTLAQLADAVKVPADAARANLASRGVEVGAPELTIGEIATANRLTPQQVYERIAGNGVTPQVNPVQSGGWGRKTVEDACRQLGVAVDTGVTRLRAAGWTAEPRTPIKDLAQATGKQPLAIVQVIAGPDAKLAPPATHATGAPAGGAGARTTPARPGGSATR